MTNQASEKTYIRGSIKEWDYGFNMAIHKDEMPQPNSDGWYRIGIGKKKDKDGYYLYVDNYEPNKG